MTGTQGAELLVVGASVSAIHTITAADIESFAHLTGDTNPIHLDAEYAAQTKFGRRIAHGMLTAGYVSAILGTRLPGPGSIYLSQSLKFTVPVYLGDSITATVTIQKIGDEKPIVTALTECVNQDGDIVLTGEATLLFRQSFLGATPS